MNIEAVRSTVQEGSVLDAWAEILKHPQAKPYIQGVLRSRGLPTQVDCHALARSGRATWGWSDDPLDCFERSYNILLVDGQQVWEQLDPRPAEVFVLTWAWAVLKSQSTYIEEIDPDYLPILMELLNTRWAYLKDASFFRDLCLARSKAKTVEMNLLDRVHDIQFYDVHVRRRAAYFAAQSVTLEARNLRLRAAASAAAPRGGDDIFTVWDRMRQGWTAHALSCALKNKG